MKAIIPAVCGLTLILIGGGCGQNPRINVRPGFEDGRVVFNITAKGINGLLGFAVMEGTNTLWEITTSYERGTKIVYGELPTGGNMGAKQMVPPLGILPPPIQGMAVTVRVDYQYDDWYPLQGHFQKSMQIPNGEQNGAANGSQPFRSETNRTSATAGSDR